MTDARIRRTHLASVVGGVVIAVVSALLDWDHVAGLVLIGGVGYGVVEIDVRDRRIPTPLLAIAAVGLIASATIAAFGDDGRRRVICAAVGVLVLGGVFLVVHLVSPSGMGFGDVRLAALLGGVAGYATATLTAPASVALLASVATIAAMAATRRRTLPYGPFLVGAALIVVAAELLA